MPRQPSISCALCPATFRQHRALRTHLQQHTCARCGAVCNLHEHVCLPFIEGGGNDFDPSPWTLDRQAFNHVLSSYSIRVRENVTSINGLFRMYLERMRSLLTSYLSVHRGCKFSIIIRAFMRETFTRREMMTFFRSGMHPLLHPSSIDVLVISCMNQIISQINRFIERGSSWTFHEVEYIYIEFARYSPLQGGSLVTLPPQLRGRHGVGNVPGRAFCFNYCMYACYLGLQTKADIVRRRSYHQIERQNVNNTIINFSRMGERVSISDVQKFQRDNDNFSVNVFGFSDGIVHPLKICSETKQYHANVLLFTNEEGESHYLYIYDFSSFMTNGEHRRYFCYNCLSPFGTEAKRNEHYELCKENKCKNLKFKDPGEVETVSLHTYSLPRGMVCVFDFESICNPNSPMPRTNKLLEPCAFSYVLVTSEGDLINWGEYVGRRCETVFVQKMDKLAERYLPLLQQYKDEIIETPEGIERCNTSTCVICGQEIEGISHRHHNHYAFPVRGNNDILIGPGELFGRSCGVCNLNLKVQDKLDIIAHNFSRFDALQMIRGIADVSTRKIDCVAKNANQFLNIKYKQVNFMDSYLHLPMSLSDLVKVLRTAGLDKFKVTRHMFREYEDQLDNLILKQTFPYNFIRWENLDIPAATLPPRSEFYNELHQADVSEADYNLACYMYQVFGCRNISDYMKKYCLLDVCLTMDCILNYRKNCWDNFRIEPLHFLSLPSMSFKLILGRSGQSLQYITDPSIYLLAKAAKRGGVVCYSDRLAFANYPNTPSYDPSLPHKSIIQLDVCGMYSSCMRRKLPVGNYRLLPPEQVATFNPLEVDDDDDTGFLVCADINISERFHDWYMDLPPMPEHVKIDASLASEFQRSYTDEQGASFMDQFKTEQLVTSLYNKKNYTLHNFLLKSYMKMGGITVEKIHHVVSYDQAPFMRDFIDLGISKRNSTEDESMKSWWKLLLNAGYGFSALDVESFVDINIVRTPDQAAKFVNRQNFKGFSIIAPSLAILESSPLEIEIRNHLLVASAVLDHSKKILYELLYVGFKPYFTERGIEHKMLYCDTDSLCMSINVDYEEMLEHLDRVRVNGQGVMDWSYLPRSHKLFSEAHKNEVGYLKSETKYNRILGFVCLKKKFYSLRVENAEDKMRGRGIPRSILAKNFKFDTYLNTLQNGTIIRVAIKLLKRLNQQIFEVSQNKMAFNSFSISRFLVPPRGVNTIPWGHYSITQGEVDAISIE